MNNRSMKLGPISTSKIEIRDLVKAWTAISFAFAVLFNRGVFDYSFVNAFLISGLTVGVGFLLHELGHKIIAQRYGCFAEFRSNDRMLLFAILFSFMGFVIAAPGAVMINGPVGKKRNGKISAAGPTVNLILASLFLGCIMIFGRNMLFDYGLKINAILGVFNMIPFGIFDGKKILQWNKSIFSIMVAIGLSLMFLQSFIS